MTTLNPDSLIWTIGSGGLIGRAINAQSTHPFHAKPIRWRNNADALEDLRSNLSRFNAQASLFTSSAIIWAAGAATTTTTPHQADNELNLFTEFMQVLGEHSLNHAINDFVLISSAGGIYAGAQNPPFTEETPPAPIGVYGNLKLQQELIAIEKLAHCDIHLTIARVSNAYGPGQDVTKLQGLISRLALCTIKREPINLFVPLSTVRDFIFTADLATRIHALIQEDSTDTAHRIRIIASEQGTSLGYLIKVSQNVFHRRIPIALGSHPSASAQAPDLRFSSLHTNSQTLLTNSTSLPIGIKATFDDLSRRIATNSLD